MTKESDARLILRVQAGEVEAYAPLVKKYQARLHFFVYRFVKDWQKAEELAQDAFVSVYKTIERIDTSRKFSTYLFAVAKNSAISYLRKARREVPISIELPDNWDMYEEVAKNHEAKKVRWAVAGLGRIYKQVVELRYFEDLSYVEVGNELNLPINTVKTRLRRAKEQLAQILKNV